MFPIMATATGENLDLTRSSFQAFNQPCIEKRKMSTDARMFTQVC